MKIPLMASITEVRKRYLAFHALLFFPNLSV